MVNQTGKCHPSPHPPRLAYCSYGVCLLFSVVYLELKSYFHDDILSVQWCPIGQGQNEITSSSKKRMTPEGGKWRGSSRKESHAFFILVGCKGIVTFNVLVFKMVPKQMTPERGKRRGSSLKECHAFFILVVCKGIVTFNVLVFKTVS